MAAVKRKLRLTKFLFILRDKINKSVGKNALMGLSRLKYINKDMQLRKAKQVEN